MAARWTGLAPIVSASTYDLGLGKIFNAGYLWCAVRFIMSGTIHSRILNYGNISNCDSNGFAAGDSSIGGLVGGNISNLHNYQSPATVIGRENIGGLLGLNLTSINKNSFEYSGYISNCYSNGSINCRHTVKPSHHSFSFSLLMISPGS